LIDLVVVLDASDDRLAARIKSRSTWHEVKGSSVQEITIWMARFRTALEWVLAGLTARGGGPRVVRISADGTRPEQVADQVSSALKLGSYDD